MSRARALLMTLVCSVGFALPSAAQDHFDAANVYYRTGPYADAIDIENIQRTISNFTANVKYAKQNSDSSAAFIAGLEFNRLDLKFKGFYPNNETFEYNYDVFSVGLQLGYKRTWNDKWETLFMAIPRLNSDFDSITSQHFQAGGLVLATKHKNDRFAWKFGTYYNSEFFGPFIIPLLGWSWKINSKWQFDLLLPVTANLIYQPRKNYRTGIMFDGSNGSYRVSGANRNYVEKLDNNIAWFNEVYMTKNIVFHAKIGHSFLRYYRSYHGDEQIGLKVGPAVFGDERTERLDDFGNSVTFEGRLIFRIPL